MSLAAISTPTASLWVYLPTGHSGDELVAYDAATGAEIDRARLDSAVGAGNFRPHPDRRRPGLYVAMGQDTPLSHLAWLDNGRITGRDLPGGFVNGFDSTGDYYLAMPHMDGEISIRELATGQAVAATDPRRGPVRTRRAASSSKARRTPHSLGSPRWQRPVRSRPIPASFITSSVQPP